MIDTLVIGGGVSGLTIAHELMLKGRDVVLLERQVAVGGNAVSERIGGYLMEHGPSSLNAAAEGADQISTRLGLDDKRTFLEDDVKYRYLTKNGSLSNIPIHPLGFFTSSHLSIRGRLAMASELFKPVGNCGGEESVDAFCRRRFGAEFAERIIDPLTGGLFAAASTDLSIQATFPALVDMEKRYFSVTAGAFSRRLAGRKMPARRLFSWSGGIATLPLALAAQLKTRIRKGVTVRRIEPLPSSFRIDAGAAGMIEARSVVIATQPHVAGMLLATIDEAAAQAALGISAPPIAVVFLGYRRAQVSHPLQGLGYLTATGEGRLVNGALFPSTMFSGRAPSGHVALAAYVGGSRESDLAGASPKTLISLVRDEFRDILGATGEPQIAHVKQWPMGLPQTSLGHHKKLEAFTDMEQALPGLFLTGNYFSGPGITHCVTRALDTACRVDELLQSMDRGVYVNRSHQNDKPRIVAHG